MKTLFVKKLTQKKVNLSEAGHILEVEAVANPIDTINWKDFSYRPRVAFRIGYTKNEIWLKYAVSEKYIRALETRTNGDVYKDSCVEFFVSFDGKNYYNLEINCIGILHLAYGSGRENRTFISPELIGNIQVETSLGAQPFEEKSGNFDWELTAGIPLGCFAFDKLEQLDGIKATANFYKCGDETAEPHYLTWNPVKTAAPDYHQPNYFGKIWFE